VKLPRPLIVITTDFYFFLAISKELRQRRIKFDAIMPGNSVPSDALILTTANELLTIKKAYKNSVTIFSVNPIEFSDYERLIAEIFASMHGKKIFNHVLIGIDPGKSTGIILDADGMILVAETIVPSELGPRLRKLLRNFISITTTIKIGGGAPNALVSLLNSITGSCPEALDLIEWVDESGTTSTDPESEKIKTFPWTKDEISALKISKRKGKSGPIPNFAKKITQGKIKEIQSWSRQLSQNKITISKKLARKVLTGEISLEEAVELQLSRNNVKINSK
jgi:hypothetical protein